MQVDNSSVFAAAISQNYRVRFVEPFATCPPTKSKLLYPGVGVLPYMGYIGMCRCEGYGFQAVYSRIGYINQNI